MAPDPTRRGSYETEYPADRHVAPLPRRHGPLHLLSLGAVPPPPETGPARISERRAWLWATRDPWPAAWGLLHLRYESAPPNQRLKLTAHVWVVNHSPVRPSLSAPC